MVRLASADKPDILCLQEVPAWALDRLRRWSGMTAFGDVASRPRLGAWLGRAVTELDHSLFRSAFAGQGNAILLGRELRALERRRLVLNPRAFRRERARMLGLDGRTQLAWARERRICQALRVERAGASTLVVANLHATSHRDGRLPAAEVGRAAEFVAHFALAGEPRVLAGDFNVSIRSEALQELLGPAGGYGSAGPGIDHVLVAGLPASAADVWPLERRQAHGQLLSDHAPVEVRIR